VWRRIRRSGRRASMQAGRGGEGGSCRALARRHHNSGRPLAAGVEASITSLLRLIGRLAHFTDKAIGCAADCGRWNPACDRAKTRSAGLPDRPARRGGRHGRGR
jgi:hypothetical protein